jgi:predicted nuclease of predicted toxin-antitoxin system
MVPRLRFLADMNLSPITVDILQREGWDMVRVSTLLPANASDAEILALARRQNRVVVTQDLDFSALLALGGYAQPSLITLRLSNTDPSLVTERLRQILPQSEQALREGSAITVDDSTLRIRRLPIR